MIKLLAPAAAALALCLCAPADAHHSFAMFDTTKQVSVAGVIKDFQYTNPHSWLIVTVPGADGKAVDWSFEAEGPSTLLRAGIKRSSLPIGDKVTVKGFPMRDGRPAGALINIIKADGSTLVFRNSLPPPVTVQPAAASASN